MRVLITGGSGFFAGVAIPFLIKEYNAKVRIMARNEWRLVEMVRANDNNPNIEMFVGDVRDRARVEEAISECDLVIHAAALKRVEVCNNMPIEAIKTNINGSINVIEACMAQKTRMIFISSDKAVNPLNLYGKTKSIIESVVKTHKDSGLQITRWGNVMGSTGAAVPYFIKLAKKGLPIPITDPRMTRFMITRKNVIDTLRSAIDKREFLTLPSVIESINIQHMAELIIKYCKSESSVVSFPMTRAEKLAEEMEIGMSSDDYIMSDERFIEMLKEEIV